MSGSALAPVADGARDLRAGDARRARGEHPRVIRNAVIHITNEQPLLVDLYGLPSPADVGMLCTNMRMMDGRRPVFVDDVKSTFFFPYLHIRFVEIPPHAFQHEDADAEPASDVTAVGVAESTGATNGHDDDPDLELDEDFLRKIREISDPGRSRGSGARLRMSAEGRFDVSGHRSRPRPS